MAEVVTKRDLIELLYDRFDGKFTKKEISEILDSFIELVGDLLVREKNVRLTPLGVIQVITKKEREGRNPKTNEKIRIPAKKTIKLRPFSEIVNALNS